MQTEWEIRCDLAAAYRLISHFGMDDLISTHLSARPHLCVSQAPSFSFPGEDRMKTEMKHRTLEDWKNIDQSYRVFASHLPDRLMAHMRLLHGDKGGSTVDRLEHSLQTATRACEDGRDDEYVVCALLHDIGDTLGPYNHGDIAAAILKPFVSEQNHWMTANHAIFQGYYYYQYYGLDINARDKYLGNPHFDVTEEFVRLYDQPSFDPNFKSMSLEEFEPMLRKVFEKPRREQFKLVGG